MNIKSILSSYFKSSEEVVSMFLGLVIVLVVVGMVFNFFQKRRGEVSVPGVSDNITLAPSKTVEKPTETKAPTLSAGEYVVKKGDSLWKIALARYNSGYRWVDIYNANKLRSTKLAVGQKLNLPELSAAVKPTPAETKNYVVVKGDSLWKISVANYGDGFKWTSIWKNNRGLIRNPNRIFPGMKLVLPAGK